MMPLSFLQKLLTAGLRLQSHVNYAEDNFPSKLPLVTQPYFFTHPSNQTLMESLFSLHYLPTLQTEVNQIIGN